MERNNFKKLYYLKGKVADFFEQIDQTGVYFRRKNREWGQFKLEPSYSDIYESHSPNGENLSWIYTIGRDFAVACSSRFNSPSDIEKYPTLTNFVTSMEKDFCEFINSFEEDYFSYRKRDLSVIVKSFLFREMDDLAIEQFKIARTQREVFLLKIKQTKQFLDENPHLKPNAMPNQINNGQIINVNAVNFGNQNFNNTHGITTEQLVQTLLKYGLKLDEVLEAKDYADTFIKKPEDGKAKSFFKTFLGKISSDMASEAAKEIIGALIKYAPALGDLLH